MSSRAKILLAAVVVLVLLPALLSACPLCKDALEDKATGVPNDLGRGFYYSILLMVSAPFAVVGGLFLRISRMRRRQRLVGGTASASIAPHAAAPDDPRGARS